MTTYYSNNNLFAYTVTSNSSYALDSSDYSIIADVFNRWDSLVSPDSRFGENYQITVSMTIDALGAGILGGTSVSHVASIGSQSFGNTLPYTASITLNDSYVISMKSDVRDTGKTEYYYVLLHEVGHVLGIGTFWGQNDAPIVSYQEDGLTKYFYTGQHAVREYKRHLSPIANDIVGIPIEDNGSAGTINVHPEEGNEGHVSKDKRYINGVFHPGLDTELMTGWMEGTPQSTPLSRITLGFLEDIGFNVNYNLADYYRPMTNWLDLSNNANCFKSIYEQGFVDLSGGSIQTRNEDQKLIIAGDSSLNNAYLGEYRNAPAIDAGYTYEQVPGFEQVGHMSVGCDTATAIANNYKLDISGTMDICGNLFSSGDISLNDYFTDELVDTEEILETRLANATFTQQITFAGDFYEQDGYFCVNKTGDRYAWKSAWNTSVYIFDICGNIMTTIEGAAADRKVNVVNALPDFSMFAVPYGDDKKLKIFVKKADFVEGVSEGYESGGDLTLSSGDDRVGRSCCRLRRHPITNDIYLCTHDGFNDIQVHKYNPNDKTWSQIGSAIPGYDYDIATGNWGSYSVFWYGHTDFAIKSDGTLVICHAQPSYNYKIDIRTYNDDSSDWTDPHDTYYTNNNEVRGVYLTENASKLFICHYTWMCRENIILSDNTFKTTGTDIFDMYNNIGTFYNYNTGIQVNETGTVIVTTTHSAYNSTATAHVGYYYLDINDNWQNITITYTESTYQPGYFGKNVAVSYYGDYVAVCLNWTSPFGQLAFFSISGDKTNTYKQAYLKKGGNMFIENDCSANGTISYSNVSIGNVNVSFSEDTNITQNQLIVNKDNNSLNQMNGFKLQQVNPYEWNSVSISSTSISYPRNIRCSDNGFTMAYTYGGANAASTAGRIDVYNYDNVAKTWTQKGTSKYGVNNLSASQNQGFGYQTGTLGMDKKNLNRIISGGRAYYSSSIRSRGFVNIIEFDSTTNDWNTVYYQYGTTNFQYLGGHKNGMSGNGNYAFASSFNDDDGTDSGNNPTYVYERAENGTWSVNATFTKTNYSDLGNAFSADVDMNYAGDMMVFCDDYETGNNAWIYKNISGTWTKMGNSINTDIYKPTSCCINNEGNIVGFGGQWYSSWPTLQLDDGVEVYEYSKSLTETDGTWTRIYKSVADISNASGTFSQRVTKRGLTMNGAGDMVLAMCDSTPTIGLMVNRKVNGAWSRTDYFLQDEITYSAAITTNNNFYLVSANDPKVEYFELNTSHQVNEMVVPGNITIIDSSANNYGAYTVYTTKDASTRFSVGKSASNVFNIVNQNNAGVYMVSGNNSLTSTSDIRLKKEIEPLEDATERIMKLNPCTYKWKTQTDEKRHVGFIAQEVEEVFTELVRETTYPDGSTYKGVATEDFVGYLIKVMENQDRRLKLLEETK